MSIDTEEMLKKASKWKDKEIIDIKGYYKRKDVFKILNKSKLIAPLIIIDPVQADRNAAAALSFENFNNFRKACKKFIKNPSKKYFVKQQFSIEKIKNQNKNKNLIFLEITPKKGKDDVIGCKLVKALNYFSNKLIENQFKIFNYSWNWDKKAIFYFILDKKTLPQTIIKEGPPLRVKEHVIKFKKRHKKTFIKNKKIYASDKRKYRKPEALIKSLFKDDYLKDKIKKIKLL